jgi:AraC-like DNA-binding protein
MRSETAARRRTLYLLSRGLVARHYRRRLTLAALARALCSSPRQIQRAYEEFGAQSFHEDLRARRLAAAATLLYEQPAIAVADVARLVGYRHAAHFARAFRTRFGVSPASFRERARRHRAAVAATDRRSASDNGGDGGWRGRRGGEARGGGAC